LKSPSEDGGGVGVLAATAQIGPAGDGVGLEAAAIHSGLLALIAEVEVYVDEEKGELARLEGDEVGVAVEALEPGCDVGEVDVLKVGRWDRDLAEVLPRRALSES
jgi:hypothetical protein